MTQIFVDTKKKKKYLFKTRLYMVKNAIRWKMIYGNYFDACLKCMHMAQRCITLTHWCYLRFMHETWWKESNTHKFQNLLPYCSTVQASTDKERRENCNRKFRNTIGELTKLCHQLSSRCWKIAIYYTRCFWVVVILSPVIRWQYVNSLWLFRIHCPPKISWFPKGRG